tara:strand:- start:103 stop:441 length:339 start_codon:yes stop_codon:yes gene_type:complete
MQNGQLYQQVLWEPVIDAVDGGLLPTPLASAGNRKAKFKQGGTPLLGVLLPTPTAREWKDGSSQSTKKCRKQDSLGRAIHHTYPPNGDHMYLNPFFVEEMMGYEVGWTDLKH